MSYVSPRSTSGPCLNCRLNKVCLPIALDSSNLEELESIVRQYTYKKGEYLYTQSDNFRSVYAVRSGSFKSFSVSPDGEEFASGFFFPGELVGLDGLANGFHVNSLQALEHASICEIHFSQLKDLTLRMPNLQSHFFSLMGREIVEGQKIKGLLGKNTAKERTVHFLLNLSQRLGYISLSPLTFFLPMTRADIGEYLGLTVETISRVFSELQTKELISVQHRKITLLDLGSLQKIIKCPGP